ncbi:MAG: CHAD domain-containing protein [Cyanobacteria bacterium P01_D01_bin.1]
MTAAPQTVESQKAESQMTEIAIAEDKSLIGGYAYQIIRQQSKQVFKLRSQVLSDSDVEDLHQMRIGTRRLRSALNLFSDTVELEGTSSTALSKSVAKLTKSLGKVRDIDVMQQWFVQMLDAASKKKSEKKKSKPVPTVDTFTKAEKKVIKSLLKTLKKRRKKQFSQLESTLDAAAYKKLVKQCKRWTKKPKFSPVAQQPAASSAIKKVVEPLAQLLQHPGWEVATTAVSGENSRRHLLKRISLAKLNQQLDQSGEQLHDLRKQIKGVRYQTEFFRGLYGIHYAAQIRELRSLQSVLGQLQDQLVVSEFLATELGANWADRLPTIYKAFQSSRLELWKQWQPLQEKYLELHERLKTQMPVDAITA